MSDYLHWTIALCCTGATRDWLCVTTNSFREGQNLPAALNCSYVTGSASVLEMWQGHFFLHWLLTLWILLATVPVSVSCKLRLGRSCESSTCLQLSLFSIQMSAENRICLLFLLRPETANDITKSAKTDFLGSTASLAIQDHSSKFLISLCTPINKSHEVYTASIFPAALG